MTRNYRDTRSSATDRSVVATTDKPSRSGGHVDICSAHGAVGTGWGAIGDVTSKSSLRICTWAIGQPVVVPCSCCIAGASLVCTRYNLVCVVAARGIRPLSESFIYALSSIRRPRRRNRGNRRRIRCRRRLCRRIGVRRGRVGRRLRHAGRRVGVRARRSPRLRGGRRRRRVRVVVRVAVLRAERERHDRREERRAEHLCAIRPCLTSEGRARSCGLQL